MAQSETVSKKQNSAKKRIWTVFIYLSIITAVEVVLGIIKPDFLVHNTLITLPILDWIFILLTVYKAYFITWAFMHMEHENKGLRRAVVWTVVFLVLYLVFILLTEGVYVHDVYKNGFVKWDF